MKRLLISMFILIVVVVLFLPYKKNISIKQRNYNDGINQKANDYLISKTNSLDVSNYDSGDIHQMYTFSHQATEQTPELTDYRYIGYDPYNYIYFNCTDEADTSTCEIWRIIGVFDVDDGTGNYEKRVKLIRGSAFNTKMRWDYDREDEDSSSSSLLGKNEWPGSELNLFLNNDYYTRGGLAQTYGLTTQAQLQIADSEFYLGQIKTITSTPLYYGNAEDMYAFERSTLRYIDSRSLNWTGKVGLMYPSDFFTTYANGVDDTCYSNPRECSRGVPKASWIYKSNNLEDIVTDSANWLISGGDAGARSGLFISNEGAIASLDVYHSYGVRPVVYLKEDIKLYGGDGSKNNPYYLCESCSENNDLEETNEDEFTPISGETNLYLGGSVIYNNSEYCVVGCNPNNDYVTLLKAEPFTYAELSSYSNPGYTITRNNGDPQYGSINYSSKDLCQSNNSSGCTNNYKDSFIKYIVDDWSNSFSNDLIEVDGYKARLLTNKELSDLGHTVILAYASGPDNFYKTVKSKYSCLYLDADYWTMNSSTDSGKYIDIVSNNTGSSMVNNGKKFVGNSSSVRPVINLKKSVVGGVCRRSKYYVPDNPDDPSYSDISTENSENQEINCQNGFYVKNYKSYETGESIEIQGENYYVIKDSNENRKYVTLLKEKSLTPDELLQYGRDENDHIFVNEYALNTTNPEKIVYENADGSGGMAYYTSETCRGDFTKFDGCKTNFNDSDVKKVLDNWAADKFNKSELVNVGKYKVRLLTFDELMDDFYYESRKSISQTYYVSTAETPNYIINNNIGYWLMTPYDDSYYRMFINKNDLTSSFLGRSNAVRPVINIDKCALEGGCTKEECQEEIVDNNDDKIKEEDNKIVDGGKEDINNKNKSAGANVANTLKNKHKIIWVVFGALLTGGLAFFTYSFIKSKKDLNKIKK